MGGSYLSGGVIQRVDIATVGGRDAALLRLRVPGETAVLVVLGGSAGRVAALPEREDRERAKGALRASGERTKEGRFRALLESAKVVTVGARVVVLRRDERVWVLEGKGRGELALVDAPEAPAIDDAEREVLEEGAAALIEGLASGALTTAKERLRRALGKATERLDRRIVAVRGDLARIATADALAARAQLFVAEASRAPRGATKLVTTDWTTGTEVKVELPLDPARSAREQIDAMFKRARRLKEGARIGEARLAEALSVSERLGKLAVAAQAAASIAEVAELTTAARTAAPKDFRDAGAGAGESRAKAKDQPRPPYRAFSGAGGARILVGRGGEHNDALTFHVGRPHDLWLHAKGRAGAHVIVPLAKSASCPGDLLIDAAHLAAHFSEARDELVTEVEYTPRKYLRKPKGSAPGFVVVSREKVVVLRKEAARMDRLLSAETDAASNQ